MGEAVQKSESQILETVSKQKGCKMAQILSELFLFWESLTAEQQRLVEDVKMVESYKKGETIHRTDNSCKGLVAVKKGQLRTYILSEEGREITLFRVADGEVCVLSASCLLEAITFDVLMEAMEDTEIVVIPAMVLKRIMEVNPAVELYLYKTATEKFSDVMWTMQQILFLKIDQRVAQFLWDESVKQGVQTLHLTHDEIAKYIGSAREVVSKVLKYLESEQAVATGRGTVTIVNKEKLRNLL